MIRLRDADGTEATLTNGANATFRRPATTVAVGAAGTPTCPSNRVVEIVVGADPQVAVAGTTAGLAVPATIIAATNLENAANIDWAISASGQDVVVDQEAAAEPA